MRLSKKQEKALNIAIDVMETMLGNGYNPDDTDFEEALNELINMEYKSRKARMVAQARKR